MKKARNAIKNLDEKRGIQKMNYSNPVIKGFYPDPSICKVKDTFYLVTSSFHYFPGVPLFKSKDLISWEQIGHCLTRESQLPLSKVRSSGGIFAPTIRHNNGRFYMVTTNSDLKKNFFVYTDNADGEWSELVYVKQGGIDPSLFFDDDGKVYFTSNGHDENRRQGIFQCEIDIETGEALTKSRCIWHGTGGRFPESPHLYKINGFYYLMIAEGGTEYGHMVTIARSKNPYGPFESCPHNPILTHRNTECHPIQGTGHGDLIQDGLGKWWIIFLGFRTIDPWMNFHHMGREVFLAPVTWDKDGWPVVNEGKNIEMDMKVEDRQLPCSIEKRNDSLTHEKEKCKDIYLPMQWSFLRNPHLENYKILNNHNTFHLKGTAITLNDVDSPTFIGVRQKEFECEFKTKLSFEPKQNGEEAGITIIMNENHHYEIAILREEHINKIILRKSIGSLKAIVNEYIYADKSVVLKIRADNINYYFSIENEQGKNIEMGEGETRYLSSEVAKGFTGVYFGLYATGNGKNSVEEAVFHMK
jgi:xylan 1,4-beta-xylosidase